MGTDLLHALQILTKLALHSVRDDLAVLTILVVLSPVEHPDRDLELLRVLDDGHQTLNLVVGELASTAGAR